VAQPATRVAESLWERVVSWQQKTTIPPLIRRLRPQRDLQHCHLPVRVRMYFAAGKPCTRQVGLRHLRVSDREWAQAVCLLEVCSSLSARPYQQQPIIPSGHVGPFGVRNHRGSNEVWYGSDPLRPCALEQVEGHKGVEA
jgi:hypothetical protein